MCVRTFCSSKYMRDCTPLNTNHLQRDQSLTRETYSKYMIYILYIYIYMYIGIFINAYLYSLFTYLTLRFFPLLFSFSSLRSIPSVHSFTFFFSILSSSFAFLLTTMTRRRLGSRVLVFLFFLAVSSRVFLVTTTSVFYAFVVVTFVVVGTFSHDCNERLSCATPSSVFKKERDSTNSNPKRRSSFCTIMLSCTGKPHAPLISTFDRGSESLILWMGYSRCDTNDSSPVTSPSSQQRYNTFPRYNSLYKI